MQGTELDTRDTMGHSGRSIFFLTVDSNLTRTWLEVAAYKNHNFSWRARDTGKLKKGNIYSQEKYERNALQNLDAPP